MLLLISTMRVRMTNKTSQRSACHDPSTSALNITVNIIVNIYIKKASFRSKKEHRTCRSLHKADTSLSVAVCDLIAAASCL
jgi:hypothetical protein